ncbi:cobaltochelatase subunit CobN [Porphyromonas pogonae]|uniref:cobaltochelatase subunit CobN n=1 Tax=Porphyromonas pogonae TaxID=867595 RepID=UPI002E760D75|nr:cobaltochelatase subunit CobN [Porphyromonas pogonae]
MINKINPGLRRGIWVVGLLLLIALGALWGYKHFLSPTRIALVYFPNYQASNFKLANHSSHIKLDVVDPAEGFDVADYKMILIFGPAFKGTSLDTKWLDRADKKKVPVYSFAFSALKYRNKYVSVDQKKRLDNYYTNRSKQNYRNMLLYIRRQFDPHKWGGNKPEPARVIPNDIYYYLDEGVFFETADAMTSYLRAKGYYHEGKGRIVLLSGSISPLEGNRSYIDSLITSLSHKGYNVYPVSASERRLDLIREVSPDAVIYFPMGRLQGDEAVQYLKEQNIPLFCPLPLTQSHDEWLKDPKGPTGGFLTARVVLGEIDGGICPMVVSTQSKQQDDIYLYYPEPERLPHFVDMVDRHLKLKHTPNKDKKVAIVYYRGPGSNALVATGLEVVPSLYNLLHYLKQQGYTVDNLPSSAEQLGQMLAREGKIFSSSSRDAMRDFLANAHPLWLDKDTYESWAKEEIAPDRYADVVRQYGAAPGSFMTMQHDGKPSIAVARLQLGNVVLLPQPRPALDGEDFQVVHGAKVAPPHSYIAAYMWIRRGFRADAIIHFGTHGNLEFTPGKATALSHEDWPDCLIGALPHFYYYSISNVGEGIIAKRRTHAALVSYLTPPFSESNLRAEYKGVFALIDRYHGAQDPAQQKSLALQIKQAVVALGVHRDLQLSEDKNTPLTAEEIIHVEDFLDEVAHEKVTGALYRMGQPYRPDQIVSTAVAISADAIAMNIAKLDQLQGKATPKDLEPGMAFNRRYLVPVQSVLQSVLSSPDARLATLRSRLVPWVTPDMFDHAHATADLSARKGMRMKMKGRDKPNRASEATTNSLKAPAPMGGMGMKTKPTDSNMKPATPIGGMPKEGTKRRSTAADTTKPSTTMRHPMGMVGMPKNTDEMSGVLVALDNELSAALTYKELLETSPRRELESLVNALNAGYIAPSPGGDAVSAPNALPTGRNMYSINTEATPTESAWSTGVALARQTLKSYKDKHGKYPRKVSFTYWAGEFIQSGGATVAQTLYMLGVEPVRDRMGKVVDIKLIPSDVLGRPRIDVVVQVSGQLRDLAASRLFMITKAVKMAADAKDDKFDNYVAGDAVEAEKLLVEDGVSPREARELSTMRVFGGVNGRYGTGITHLVERGDAWTSEQEVADEYLRNMGAIYGDEEAWGAYHKSLFKVALMHTDAIVQPRQNNTWGALSLDHMYEFMGGINLSSRNVNGKDPETYLADYRNRSRVRMQDLKEAIGVESRATLFNPNYIKEKMHGGATTANTFAKTIRNAYGWNVMKPQAIDHEFWDQIYEVYVRDTHHLDVEHYFRETNPAALEEITAVMMETARKGLWKATPGQLKDIAAMNASLVADYGTAHSEFTASNKSLRQFIARQLTEDKASEYLHNMSAKGGAKASDAEGVVMKKDELRTRPTGASDIAWVWPVAIVLLLFVLLLLWLRAKNKKRK